MESCNGEDEAVDVGKNTVDAPIASVHLNSSNNSRRMCSLAWEMDVAISIMNVTMSKEPRYQIYKRCNGELL